MNSSGNIDSVKRAAQVTCNGEWRVPALSRGQQAVDYKADGIWKVFSSLYAYWLFAGPRL